MDKKTIAAGIFIIRKDKKLLICHPTNHKLDFFSIPKGKKEIDEGLLDCALRETEEETNLNLRKTTNFSIHVLPPVEYAHKKKILHPFVYLENQDSTIDWETMDIKCNSRVPKDRGGFLEMDSFKWSTIDEARPLLHETQVDCLDKVLELSNDVITIL